MFLVYFLKKVVAYGKTNVNSNLLLWNLSCAIPMLYVDVLYIDLSIITENVYYVHHKTILYELINTNVVVFMRSVQKEQCNT